MLVKSMFVCDDESTKPLRNNKKEMELPKGNRKDRRCLKHF